MTSILRKQMAESTREPDHYEVLGLKRDATIEEIKTKQDEYNNSSNQVNKAQMEQAFAVLTDQARKNDYDNQLQEMERQSAAEAAPAEGEVVEEEDAPQEQTSSPTPKPEVTKKPNHDLIERLKNDKDIKKDIKNKEIEFTDSGISFKTPEQLGKIIKNIADQDKVNGIDKLEIDLNLKGDVKDHKKYVDEVVKAAKEAGYSPDKIELKLNGKPVDLAKDYGPKAEKKGEVKPTADATATAETAAPTAAADAATAAPTAAAEAATAAAAEAAAPAAPITNLNAPLSPVPEAEEPAATTPAAGPQAGPQADPPSGPSPV